MSNSEESGSETSAPEVPSDEKLEKGLRDTVANVFKTGKLEELTVKRLRLATEKALGLEEGFFKGDARWKAKSDQIIKDEVEKQEKRQEEKKEEDEEEASPIPPEKAQAPPKKTKPAKRAKPEEAPKPRKRRKTSTPPESEGELSDAPSDEDEEGPVKKPGKKVVKKARNKRQPDPTKDVMSDESDIMHEPEAKKPSAPETDADKEASESELSVPLDEEPMPKSKRQKSASAESKGKKGGKQAAAKAKDADLDPDQAEIKRLQGWLVKCGIRKMWFRELAPYDTPKAKIKHLRDMLKEAGMDGRYSLEKAKQIREERELMADLETVQEGAKRWGTGSADEEMDDVKPKRRLARGRKVLAFLSDDGEETD